MGFTGRLGALRAAGRARSRALALLLLAGCSSSVIVLPTEPSPDRVWVVAVLGADDVLRDATIAPADDAPFRRTLEPGAARIVVLELPTPADEAGRPLSTLPVLGPPRGCACSLPMPAGRVVLAAGDECELPQGARATAYAADGDVVEGADADRLVAIVRANLRLGRDGGCRRAERPHAFAAGAEACDILPAHVASTFAIDGAGRVLTIAPRGQVTVHEGATLLQRWSVSGRVAPRGLSGGGFLVVSIDEARGVRVVERVTARDRQTVSLSAPIEHVDSTALDLVTDAPLFVGRDADDRPLIAACDDDGRCGEVALPCGITTVPRSSIDARSRLVGLGHDRGLAWRDGADWTCVPMTLPEGRRPQRAFARAGAVFVYAATETGEAGALYRSAAPLGPAARFDEVGRFDDVGEAFLAFADSGDVWLVGERHAIVVTEGGQARGVPIAELPELGALTPDGFRSAGDWSATRVVTGRVFWRRRGGPLQTRDPAIPGGAPLVPLDGSRALALDAAGPLLLDLSRGCESATATPMALDRWPAPRVAARWPGDDRVLLAGDTPQAWVAWGSLSSGALLGAPQIVPDVRAWRRAVAFLPGTAALVDDAGVVFVAGPGGVTPLEPQPDDPSTAGVELLDAGPFDVAVGCEGAAWVAGEGPASLGRVATDGEGGFRLETFWGVRAQLARSGEARATAFRYLALACVDAHDVLSTADVTTELFQTVATARYAFARDTTARSTADTAGRVSGGAIGWAGAPERLIYLRSSRVDFARDEERFPTPLVSFAESDGGVFLSFGGPARRFAWLRPR